MFVDIVNKEEVATFNSFWDASRYCLFLCLHLLRKLSIPSGMLPMTLATHKSFFLLFLSIPSGMLLISISNNPLPESPPFNSFWDASECTDTVGTIRSEELSIPSGMLPPSRWGEGVARFHHFQFLLGCF